MEAKGVPEKLYLLPNGLISYCRNTDEDVEYTCTDAFIEKACEWLKESVTNNPECNRIISKKGVITMGELIKDFKNYMKGE